jgi:uncharacterized protein involved in exopolysaccharide biosynthesis
MSLIEQINILKKEALRRPNTIATTVLLVSLFMLGLGLLWSERYESTALIYVENEKIIAPLLQGATVTQDMENQVELARLIVHRRDVMEDIIAQGGWLDAEPPLTLLERETLIEQLRRAIRIESASENTIEIAYRNPSPERAFKVVMTAASALLSRAREAKQLERRNAYRFISAEAEKYRQQLQESEQRLKAFLAENDNFRPGIGTQVDTNITDLRRNIQSARLDLEAARIAERSLLAQLEGGPAASGRSGATLMNQRGPPVTGWPIRFTASWNIWVWWHSSVASCVE